MPALQQEADTLGQLHSGCKDDEIGQHGAWGQENHRGRARRGLEHGKWELGVSNLQGLLSILSVWLSSWIWECRICQVMLFDKTSCYVHMF